MKVIIAGSREIKNYSDVVDAIKNSGFDITTIICGMARGVDLLGKKYAEDNKIPIDPHPALWEKYGKASGFIRNQNMANCADALIAIWDGKSAGTQDMINKAIKKGLKVYIKIISDKK